MPRHLIEHDTSLAEISEAYACEKSIRHGHPSTLRIRQPVAAARAMALVAQIDDLDSNHPEERLYL